MASTKRYYWLARREDFEAKEAWQVLDLLRYDRAIVEDHSLLTDAEHTGFVLLSTEQPPNCDRLRSYGVRIIPTERGVYRDKSEATEYALHTKKADLERIKKSGLSNQK